MLEHTALHVGLVWIPGDHDPLIAVLAVDFDGNLSSSALFERNIHTRTRASIYTVVPPHRNRPISPHDLRVCEFPEAMRLLAAW